MKPTIKGRVHMDEKYVQVKKGNGYDLNAIDHKTKYVLSHSFVKNRTKEEVLEFLRKIKITCYEQILEVYLKEKHKKIEGRNLITFVSDGFENYKNAFNKLFYRIATLQFGVPIACKRYGLEYNNNPIERYNGSLKDRLKTLRGGFGSFERAEHFLNVKHIIYNFVNPHMQLKGKTPAEEADINLKLERQKLLNLIKYQSEHK